MGREVKKRKIRKIADKKFVFDWEASEDTSQDNNPLYADRHNAVLFGRGLIAGIDPAEQRKASRTKESSDNMYYKLT